MVESSEYTWKQFKIYFDFFVASLHLAHNQWQKSLRNLYLILQNSMLVCELQDATKTIFCVVCFYHNSFWELLAAI